MQDETMAIGFIQFGSVHHEKRDCPLCLKISGLIFVCNPPEEFRRSWNVRGIPPVVGTCVKLNSATNQHTRRIPYHVNTRTKNSATNQRTRLQKKNGIPQNDIHQDNENLKW
jgi:hypothetical protein